jgi:hypothetical protein
MRTRARPRRRRRTSRRGHAHDPAARAKLIAELSRTYVTAVDAGDRETARLIELRVAALTGASIERSADSAPGSSRHVNHTRLGLGL